MIKNKRKTNSLHKLIDYKFVICVFALGLLILLSTFILLSKNKKSFSDTSAQESSTPLPKLNENKLEGEQATTKPKSSTSAGSESANSNKDEINSTKSELNEAQARLNHLNYCRSLNTSEYPKYQLARDAIEENKQSNISKLESAYDAGEISLSYLSELTNAEYANSQSKVEATYSKYKSTMTGAGCPEYAN